MNRKDRRALEAKTRRGQAPAADQYAKKRWTKIHQAEAQTVSEIFDKQGVNPASLDEALANAHEFAGLFVNQKVPIACGVGCYYCCHQKVGTTAVEIVHMATELRARQSPEQLAATIEGLRKIVEQRGPAGADPVRCNFLDDEGGCRIYELRPLACRSVTSTTSEPCRAWLEDGNAIGKVADQARYEAHNAVMHGLDQAASAHGYEGGFLDFHNALYLALSNPSAMPDWFEGRRPFATTSIPPKMRRLPVVG